MLSSEKDCPGDAAGIFALEKEGFCLAILEAEDLAVTTDVKLALFILVSRTSLFPSILSSAPPIYLFLLK